MKRLATIAAIILIAFVAYGVAFPSATVRYRLTLDAEVNGEPRTGAGVIEVWYSKNVRLLGASADLVSGVVGEAISIDLGKNDALFILLTRGKHPRSGPEDIIPVLFGLTSGGIGPEDIRRIGALAGRRDVQFELLPLMVRLRNVADPKSAELVQPNDFASSIGSGSRLIRATIEIVNAGSWPLSLAAIAGVPVSRGIQLKLPWLIGFKGYSGGQFRPDWSRPEKNLTGSDFIRG